VDVARNQEIGGVGGALAQHAEETLSRVGEERTPLVRELFRNLVTAHGTRASREVEELLSIFPKEDDRKAAGEVLRELIAARVLTAYETNVEISTILFSPRGRVSCSGETRTRAAPFSATNSVRRPEHGWTGAVPRIFYGRGSPNRALSLLRESYAGGGLSSTEEAFAQAATKRRSHFSPTRARGRCGLPTEGLLSAQTEYSMTEELLRQAMVEIRYWQPFALRIPAASRTDCMDMWMEPGWKEVPTR
jgi:hypothetical protein